MRKRVVVGVIAAAMLGGMWLANASFLAPAPAGRPTLIAQRGVHQLYRRAEIGDDTCTAALILPPRHRLIENTLPSIRAAFDAGADVVEVDTRRSRDGQFVLFHDEGLDCRTEGHGRISDHTAAELKTLDVGYGYTADGGRSQPLRGAGAGLIPTLDEALSAFPDRSFLIQVKGGARDGEALARYLAARRGRDGARLSIFGDPAAVGQLKALRPDLKAWTFKQASRCTLRYLVLGWSGYVAKACDGGMVVVPTNYRVLAWGWPNRLATRMRRQGAAVLLIGRLEHPGPTGFARFDTPDDLKALPERFDGVIWTDRVEVIGPALRRRR